MLEPLDHLLQVVDSSLNLIINLVYFFLKGVDLHVILLLNFLNTWVRIPGHKWLYLRVKDDRLHLISLDLAVDCKWVFEQAVPLDCRRKSIGLGLAFHYFGCRLFWWYFFSGDGVGPLADAVLISLMFLCISRVEVGQWWIIAI